jgi:hypothetical protein
MTNSPTAGMNTSSEPAMTPAAESGKVICQKLARRRAEVGGRFEQAAVHPLERSVDGQDHERQVGIDQADDDTRIGVGDLKRGVDQPAQRSAWFRRPSGLRMPIQA